MFEKIKRIIKRESLLWKLLKYIQKINKVLRKKLFKNKWDTNAKLFFSSIEDYSEEENVFFVQIGACDGKLADPLSKFINKYNWEGIFVEPQKEEFKKLKESYKLRNNLFLENSAIDETKGQKKLYQIKKDKIRYQWERGLATFYPKRGLAAYDKKYLTFELINCVTFSSLFKKYNVKSIDLLQIDVEGFDYKILKLFNFKLFKPKFVRFEYANLSSKEKKLSKKLLKNLGYTILEEEHDISARLK